LPFFTASEIAQNISHKIANCWTRQSGKRHCRWRRSGRLHARRAEPRSWPRGWG